MQRLTYEATTASLMKSRILKFALIAIGTLLLIQIAAFAAALWTMRQLIAIQIPTDAPAEVIAAARDKIAGLKDLGALFVGISATGGIATIATAVIGRYGLREVSRNMAEASIQKQLQEGK